MNSSSTNTFTNRCKWVLPFLRRENHKFRLSDILLPTSFLLSLHSHRRRRRPSAQRRATAQGRKIAWQLSPIKILMESIQSHSKIWTMPRWHKCQAMRLMCSVIEMHWRRARPLASARLKSALIFLCSHALLLALAIQRIFRLLCSVCDRFSKIQKSKMGKRALISVHKRSNKRANAKICFYFSIC